MIPIIIFILAFVFSIKIFLFWLWLWQLKEYHLGRFIAHFHFEKIKKITGSFLICLIFVYLFSFKREFFYFFIFFFVPFIFLFSSLLVFIFQIPTVILRNKILTKARKKREKFKDLLVIGITGSYGKTSTKEFLAEILSEKFGEDKILKTKKHENSEIAIARSILNELNENHKIFIVEMGAYNKGGIKLLAGIAKPKIGIITGINEQHLAIFGSMENLISAEGGRELIDALPEGGLIIFNGNNNYSKQIYDDCCRQDINKKICYSNFLAKPINEKYHLIAEKIKIEKDSLSFSVSLNKEDFFEFKTNLLGGHNIENILLAVCVALEAGLTLEEILRASLRLKPLPHQMELKKGINGLNIIDASYSSNPEAIIAHLDYLKIWPGKKIIIMLSLIELGVSAKKIHTKIGKKIGQTSDLAIIMTEECYQELREGSKEISKDKEVLLIKNPEKVLEKINQFDFVGQEKESVILLESRIPPTLIKKLTV